MALVNVCDAIMGSGKTQATITFIREHPEKKIIYVTPYLDEAARIIDCCPEIEIYEPLKSYQYRNSKVVHTLELVRNGKSVATTHQALKRYPTEMIDLIQRHGYILIIDEDVDVLQEIRESPGDIRMAIDAGYLSEYEDGVLKVERDDYDGEALRNVFQTIQSRELIWTQNGKGDRLHYWLFPPEFITAFEEVYVLTYMFECQCLCSFFQMYGIPYRYIGIRREGDTFRFSNEREYVPAYAFSLINHVRILESERMNEVGNLKTALSSSWFDRNEDGISQISANLGNYFNNLHRSENSSRRMWSTFEKCRYQLRGKGYSRRFVPFNIKATNQYSDRDVLAYCANVYMNVGQKLFYQKHGVQIDDDLYALSTMVQWIWRSAIRNGKDVDIYLPSRRMRELLTKWMSDLSRGNIFYEKKKGKD